MKRVNLNTSSPLQKYSRQYELGELGIAGLSAISERVNVQVAPVVMAAVRLYDFIKSQKMRYGHTIFPKEQILSQFRQHASTPPSAADVATGALMWLARGEHMLFINGRGETVRDQVAWFSEQEPIRDLQLPSDEILKLKIVGHLKAKFSSVRTSNLIVLLILCPFKRGFTQTFWLARATLR